MRRAYLPPLRKAASFIFLLLMIILQAGKLIHIFEHTAYDRSVAASTPAGKYEGAQVATKACSICSFECCRNALPEDSIEVRELPALATSRFASPTASISHARFLDADWRGPPCC